MWDIFVWIVIGGLAGWVASKVMKTDGQQGLIGNIVIGVVGALIGGFVLDLIGGSGGISGINIWSFLVALLGSIILIAILKVVRGRKG
ncbi:MAG: GlsB/YeaQ/YmgE family stress response membrane protein [Clostridia bacterium]|nr:GlsB/YeaQ/YmgE family stress response membrane protein [Clostridia bacterium]NLF21029.1 GlsB/YeaQ/YmgE family stress response membrane protein [Clostridiaceae bacterium]